MMKFLRHIFLLTAMLMAATNAWAAATCHTVTKSTFTTDATYKSWGITYYYYSQKQQQFLQINDNGYATISSVTFTVTGDQNDDAQKFRILYNTGSGWQYYDDTEHSLSRGSLWEGYPAGTKNITLSNSKIKNATAFGIEFTNFYANGSGDRQSRTLTISNVSVSFSNYFVSYANGTTLEAFPSTEKGKTCTTKRTFNYQYNNTITSVNWTTSNSMFTISSSHTDDCSGEGTVTISFTPSEIRPEITGTITGTANTGQTITVNVVGSSWGKEDPTYTWNSSIWNGSSQAREIFVGETIDNILSYTSSQANCTYSIEKLEDFGINNGDAITTFANNQLIAGRAGKYKLTVTQPEYSIDATSGYNAGTTSIIINIQKRTLTAHISQSTAVWNERIENPFSFTTSPNNEKTIVDYEIKNSNPAIATYDANSKTLQTYYTNGTASFQITRPEDRKYNALSQTCTLTVKNNTNECYLVEPCSDQFDCSLLGQERTFTPNSWTGIPNQLSFYARSSNGTRVGNVQVQQYVNGTWNTIEEINPGTSETYYSYTLGSNATQIRFYNSYGSYTRYFSNVTVTRKQNITPSIAEGATLTLPTVAINQNCSNTFNLNWSTCSEVKIVSNSDKFTIGTPDNSSKEISLTNPDGNQTFTIYCNTSETGTFEGTITIYDQADKASFNVTATVNPRWTPEMTGAESYSKLVDDTWVADFQFKNTETAKPSADSNAPFYFTIQHTSFVNDDSARKPGHTNEVISYDPETYTITAHNAGTAVLTFIQKDTPGYYPASCSCTITVAKHQSNFQMKMDNFTCEIDAVTDETNFFSKEAKNDVDATIDINITEIANDDHPEVLVFDNSTRKFTAASAGRAMVTISQPVHYKWTEYTGTINIEVKKHTPIFTWNDPVYFNQKITDYFTTNNHDTEITISQPSTDEDVAILYFDPENEEDKHTLDLTTYYKETTPLSSTQVTVSQAENWYWYAYEEPRNITPCNQNNHVTFTLTQENYIRDFQVPGGFSDPWAAANGPTWTEGGIHLGNEGIGSGDGGWNWDDKYIIIEFTGIPNTLKFTTNTATGATTGTNSDLFFYVSEGKRNTNGEIEYTKTWEYTSASNDVTETLNPESRILKFCFTGNLEGWFKDITVTELNQFETDSSTLNFGTIHITDTTTESLSFALKYANAGQKIKIELDPNSFANTEAYELAKKYIELTIPESIKSIGGEKFGTSDAITVRFHSDDQTAYTIPENARIIISDEANHTSYVNLSGTIVKNKNIITWSDYFRLAEPIQIPISTDTICLAATSSSGIDVKYKSSNEEVLKVTEDSLCFFPIGAGYATITAYDMGDAQYAYVESTKNIQVTSKNIQLISWEDDLSDLILGIDTTKALTAKVHIIDVVNNTFEVSEEQTAKIVYSVADTNIVALRDTVLTIKALGSTTITASIAEDESHEGATVTLPVVVRQPAIGCEDLLLVDLTSEEQFFQMNTNEIIKDAIAIDRSIGIPATLKFEHKGEKWSSIFYTGEIVAQQSTDGGNTFTDIANSAVEPTVGTYNTKEVPISRDATHIRFRRPSGGQGYHYYKNVQVTPAQYLEVSTNSIDFRSINMGSTYEKSFTISYSNIKSPLLISTTSTDVVVDQNHIGECGDFGTLPITITWTPETNHNQSITIQDTLANLTATINLVANIQRRKQKIVWEDCPNPKVIFDYSDIDNRPTYTRNAKNDRLIDKKIIYEVTEGNNLAYFENDMFFIEGAGNIIIRAYHPGDSEYMPVDSTYNFVIQGVSPTFIGGAADSLWTTNQNWLNGAKPNDTQTANITAPVIVNTEIEVNKLRVATSGSLHITSTGGLTIGAEGIQCANNDGSAIIIDNLKAGAGFFRIDQNYNGEMPRITMRYETKSTLDSGANKDATWQYIGAPGEDASVHVDYNTWLYRLDESQADWVLMPQLNNHTLSPFQGYALTQYGQPTYEWNAQMINRNCTIPLTYHFDGRKGQNLIANSYTAPIDVTQMLPENFQMIEGQSEYYDITQTLYLYNSGSWNAWHTQDSLGKGISSDGNNTTPGQYYAIPVLAVAEGYIPERPTIAPMQGIYVRVRAKKTGGDTHVGNIIFDYDRIVMGEGHDMHRPMRAPKKSDIASIPSENFRRLRIVATSEHSGADRLYIIQDDINTRNYDNGYDAPNQATQGIVNIYTYESGGKMEVSCANNIDSTYIGFMAGEDRTYTLHFNAIIGETLYLQDLVSGEKIYIVEDGTYTFEAEPQSTNNKRFLLHAKRAINSDMEDVNAAHIWFSNHTLYVTNATDNSLLQLYDVSGHMIFSSTIHRTPYTVDLTHLTEGVYMARVNNQVYKFVCK